MCFYVILTSSLIESGVLASHLLVGSGIRSSSAQGILALTASSEPSVSRLDFSLSISNTLGVQSLDCPSADRSGTYQDTTSQPLVKPS